MMTLEDKINKVIGSKYDYKVANCWDLVRHLNENAPDVKDIHEGLLSTAKKFRSYEEEYKDNCKVVMFPKDGDIILLGNGELFTHAGISYADGVVHAAKVGVIWQPLHIIKKLFKRQKAYRCE